MAINEELENQPRRISEKTTFRQLAREPTLETKFRFCVPGFEVYQDPGITFVDHAGGVWGYSTTRQAPDQEPGVYWWSMVVETT